MKERPILFSAPMVRALLAGTKTQTRRIVKGPGTDYIAGAHSDRDDPCNYGYEADDGEWYTLRAQPRGTTRAIACPYGQPGEHLWVRETHAIERWTREYGNTPPLPKGRPWEYLRDVDGCGEWFWPHYRATDPAPDLSRESTRCRTCEAGDPGPHWRPSIHMPRWASRISLEITEIRVERLRGISDEDAFAEGVEPCGHDGYHTDQGTCSFRTLWDAINGAGAWNANPWVWAISFRRVTP